MITIGISVYNGEKYIESAIKSILCQSFQHWQLIIIDDGSTDNGYLIIQKYLTDPRIQVIMGENQGLISRLNELVSLSKTKYFARMDADDMMHPNRLSVQVAYLEDHQNVDLVGTAAVSIDEANDVLGVRLVGNDFSTQSILKMTPFIHPSVTGKTDWFRNNKYAVEFHRAEDFELWIRTAKISKFYNISDPLLFYREGDVDIANYLASNKTVLKVYHRYNYLFDNWFLYQGSVVKRILKGSLYWLFGIFNLQRILVKHRSSNMSNKQKLKYIQILKEIDGCQKAYLQDTI